MTDARDVPFDLWIRALPAMAQASGGPVILVVPGRSHTKHGDRHTDDIMVAHAIADALRRCGVPALPVAYGVKFANGRAIDVFTLEDVDDGFPFHDLLFTAGVDRCADLPSFSGRVVGFPWRIR